MREILIKEIIQRSLGPKEGSYEKIYCADPRKEYITGIIASSDICEEDPNPDNEEVDIFTGGSGDDEISTEIFGNTDPNKLPCSFGISFIVPCDSLFDVCVTWGRYFRKEDNMWERKPFKKIENEVKIEDKKIVLFRSDEGRVLLDVKKRQRHGDKTLITLTVVNDLNSSKFGNAESCLFQPSIRVLVGKGVDTLFFEKCDRNALMYRNIPVLSRGHLCSAVWKEMDCEDQDHIDFMWPDGIIDEDTKRFIRPDLRSDFIPLSMTKAPNSEWPVQYEKPVLNAEALSQIWDPKAMRESLMPLADAYSYWKDENSKEVKKEIVDRQLGNSLLNVVDVIYEEQQVALEGIKEGIETICTNEIARLAFCYANKAISLQYEWSGKKFDWRPFQLGFILKCIESISNEKSEKRKNLELLWVPTGGGKTEAYLALMAFTIMHRRFCGESESLETGGVTVLSRYTLRALTIQQFRRTLRLVTAMECLRLQEGKEGMGWRPNSCVIKNLDYGAERISCGLWVGSSITPNKLRDAIKYLKKYSEDKLTESNPAQIQSCPVCGNILCVPPQKDLAERDTIWIKAKNPKNHQEEKIQFLTKSIIEENMDDVKVKFKLAPGEIFIRFSFERTVEKNQFENITNQILHSLDAEKISFSHLLPGYVNINDGFDVICTNPDCSLNSRKYSRNVISIPGYTVDEQIYSRCPTIVISTVDKIAMVPYEPMTATLFGVANQKSEKYGYAIKALEETYIKKFGWSKRAEWKTVNNFKPPELIVQDELHLVDGPLGSIYGQYEMMIDTVIRYKGILPKYLASTATISNAEDQVAKTYARTASTFPPVGYSSHDNFFIRTDKEGEEERHPIWNDSVAGRVYLGVSTPSFGPLTPIVRLWAMLLNGGDEARNVDFKEHGNVDNAKKYWTIVGYFNAIRELGGAVSLYREDVREWLAYMSPNCSRKLDENKTIELSGRTSSAELPSNLEKIEGSIKDEIDNMFDAIFTTSLFGTGVDISFLSTMMINGQPKSTAQYIQASGRVGRSRGGLVVTFLRNTRPRDSSHYEMFNAYHSRLYLDIEPISVNPLSPGAVQRSIGPVVVGMLRMSFEHWMHPSSAIVDDATILMDDVAPIKALIKDRFSGFVREEDIDKLISEVNTSVKKWIEVSDEIIECGEGLQYAEIKPYGTLEKNVVLGSVAHSLMNELKVVFPNAPMSLRDVEESTSFEV